MEDSKSSNNSSRSSPTSFTIEMNRQNQTQMHESMGKDIVNLLTENTVELQKLRTELLELKTLILKAFKKQDESELNFTLPIKNIDDLTLIEDAFETWSKRTTKALLKVFTKELQKNIEENCDTLEESIQRLLKKLFDDTFIIQCYWRKRFHPADKYELEFSKLIACVYISLEKIWPDFTEKQFEYVIMNWLENTKIKFISVLLKIEYNN